MFATLMRGIIVWPALLGRSDVTGARQAAAIDEAIDMFLTYYAAAPKPRPRGAASP
jgi:hypothetical protein